MSFYQFVVRCCFFFIYSQSLSVFASHRHDTSENKWCVWATLKYINTFNFIFFVVQVIFKSDKMVRVHAFELAKIAFNLQTNFVWCLCAGLFGVRIWLFVFFYASTDQCLIDIFIFSDFNTHDGQMCRTLSKKKERKHFTIFILGFFPNSRHLLFN